jgi:hypothetical protein
VITGWRVEGKSKQQIKGECGKEKVMRQNGKLREK